MSGTAEWPVSKVRRDGGPEQFSDRVVVELPLEISVNGTPLVALMRMPGQDRELAVGFCLTEGIIDSVEQILLIKHCGEAEGRDTGSGAGEPVRDPGHADLIELEVKDPRGTGRFASAYVVRTGCGGADLRTALDLRAVSVHSELRFPPAVVFDLGKRMAARQEVFRGTGGTHGAAVYTAEGEELAVREDVGRHNALDKVVGACALRGVPLGDKLLFISGRVSYEMALKAARAGFPALISLAAPTLLGLRLAEEAGLTVIGFSDGRRFNVYTHGWRVEG